MSMGRPAARWVAGRLSRRALTAADARKRAGGENDFHRDLEVLGDPQRQVQARAVLAALQVADGLVVDAECVGELGPGDAPLGAEHGDAVVDDLAHRSTDPPSRSPGWPSAPPPPRWRPTRGAPSCAALPAREPDRSPPTRRGRQGSPGAATIQTAPQPLRRPAVAPS